MCSKFPNKNIERVIISSLLSIPVEFFKNYLKVAFKRFMMCFETPEFRNWDSNPSIQGFEALNKALQQSPHTRLIVKRLVIKVVFRI